MVTNGKIFVWGIIGLAGIASVMFTLRGEWRLAAFYALTALINWVVIC
jgi:hypothetical protein